MILILLLLFPSGSVHAEKGHDLNERVKRARNEGSSCWTARCWFAVRCLERVAADSWKEEMGVRLDYQALNIE